MVYQLNDKYYIKVSGYLIEIIPSLKDGALDFKPTQNKIEITSDLVYKATNIDDIRNELKNNRNEESQISEPFHSKSNKISERTHNKYKFNKE